MSFDINKVQELLAEAAAGCYQQNGFPQKKGVEESKFAGVMPEKFADFSQVLAMMEESQDSSTPEKAKKLSPLAEGINASLQQMGITSLEMLSTEGAGATVLRGYGPDYPNGCVVRITDSQREGKAVNTPIVLQPYDSTFVNAAGEIVADPLTPTPKKDDVTGERLASGARIDVLPEVVSLGQVAKYLVSTGQLAEADVSNFTNEAYKQFYKDLPQGYISLDHNPANLCVFPGGKVGTYDLGDIVPDEGDKKSVKRHDNMVMNAESLGLGAGEVGSTAAQEAVKLAAAQKGLTTLQKGSSVAPVTPQANKTTPSKMKM
ncbi:MAG: hypothetical protein K8R48_05755 [Alphaproteobacteria bacterium]|nr:hypothetical protein [Alphaproteobacteria bacterium]